MKLRKRKHVTTDADERLYLASWLMMDVTAAIGQAMKEHGLQQKDVAQRLGTTAANVSQMLEGSRNLTLRSLAEMAWAVDAAVRVNLQPLAEFDAQTSRPSRPAPPVALGTFRQKFSLVPAAPRVAVKADVVASIAPSMGDVA